MFCSNDPDEFFVFVGIAILISVLPLVALFYSAVVWFSYAFYREVHWSDRDSLLAMAKRWILVVASWVLACGVALACGPCRDGDDHEGSSSEGVMGATLAAMAVAGFVAIRCVRDTRRAMVVGVEPPPANNNFGTNLRGRFVVVTGANNGIGKETAKLLAARGATVAMLCRNAARAKRAVSDILEELSVNNNNNAGAGADDSNALVVSEELLPVVPIDLADLASIRTAVTELKKHLRIRSERTGKPEFVHALVCNAGLMMGTQSTTKDGFETMMQANHLGHFLLTKLMLEEGMLRTTPPSSGDNDDGDGDGDDSNGGGGGYDDEPSRVCLLTSSTYEFAASSGGFDFEDPYCSNGIRTYTLFGQYSMTKLANLLTARELARRYNDENNKKTALAVFAVHPGIVRTNVTSNMNWYWRLGNFAFGWIVASLSKTAEEGAYSTVKMVLAPLSSQLPYWKEGSYVVNGRARSDVHPYVKQSGDDAKRLWDWSEEQLAGANKSALGRDEKKEQ